MTVFQHLAADCGVMAALDEDKAGTPAGKIFDHPAMLCLAQRGERGGVADKGRR